MSPITQWERYQDGSAEAEQRVFAKLAVDILDVQVANRKKAHAGHIQRAFHTKSILGVANARLQIDANVPAHLRVGYFQPNAEYRTTVRFSNADGTHRPDNEKDMRGIALRVAVSQEESHDLLMTNFPVSHARNAVQFVTFARIAAGSRLLLLFRLLWNFGISETLRMVSNLSRARRRCATLAGERYWSRGAILWGAAGPVRFQLRPAAEAPSLPGISEGRDHLRLDLAERLRGGEMRFHLFVQPYIDERRTPVEDTAIQWPEDNAVRVATLIIPGQDVAAKQAVDAEHVIDDMAFNPWNTTDEFRPLGNLNRARKEAYRASSSLRLERRFRVHKPLRNVIFGALLSSALKVVNRFVPWHKLPWRLGLANLSAFREELREKNLIDTEPHESPPQAVPVPPEIPAGKREARTIDGTYNDLSEPKMGSVGTTFGRSMQPTYRPDLFGEPNPFDVSRRLFTRERFIPAESLNVIAAAWIQFQVHDWVAHPRRVVGSDTDIIVPLPKGTEWQSYVGGPSEPRMRIADNVMSHMTPGPEGYPVFRNKTTPWWDGSEVYGDTAAHAAELRNGASIRLDNGYLPTGVNGMEVTGFNESWWLGLSMMHTLFAREHNTVCEALQSKYRDMSPEKIYQTARLIVSALIAKIHTIEWTPAILATRILHEAMYINWRGAPKDWLTQLGLWLVDTHALKGIPETLPDHHGTPYSLTEEFTSVYRLHPLIPDEYTFYNFEELQRQAKNPQQQASEPRRLNFNDVQGAQSDEVMRQVRLHNVIYSLGVANPGKITLHNFPRALQAFKRRTDNSPREEIVDLSVVDLVRDRRRGVPRYNDFRAALHKPRIRRWEEFSNDAETVRALREVYHDKIDMVDTMTGLHAEVPPAGFGFSDTAFRIFIVMASRRLQSDRFLTSDFGPELYTQLGIDWIQNNGMTSVILRHCPQLEAVLPRTACAFAPFNRVQGGGP